MKNSTRSSHYVHALCTDLRTKSDFCLTQHNKLVLYNKRGECWLRGTIWVLICTNRYDWPLKGNKNNQVTMKPRLNPELCMWTRNGSCERQVALRISLWNSRCIDDLLCTEPPERYMPTVADWRHLQYSNCSSRRGSIFAFRRGRKTVKSGYYLRHVCPSAWNNSAPTRRIIMKFDTWGFFFRKSAEKIQFSLKSDKNNEYTKICVHSR